MEHDLETKLRKSCGQTSHTADEENAQSASAREVHEQEGKGLRLGPTCWRLILRHLIRRIKKRWPDIVATSYYWTAVCVGHWYTMEVLLTPPMPCAGLVFAVYAPIHLLFNLSWLGIVYHGPGRLKAGSVASLPPAVAAALKIGQMCKEHKFGPDTGWCDQCNQSKPVVLHHCGICNSCSMWMDHHCNFASVCVGFRNLRCYIVWLGYGHALFFLWIFLTVVRLPLEPPASLGAFAGLAAWCYYLFHNLGLIHYYYVTTTDKIFGGWPSLLGLKFEGAWQECRELEKQLEARLPDRERKNLDLSTTAVNCNLSSRAGVLLQLVRARGATLCQNGRRLQGLWAGPDDISSLAVVFGEPSSWHWLLPLVPGGTGDPVAPQIYDAAACNTWASLVAAMRPAVDMIEEDQRQDEELIQRMSDHAARAEAQRKKPVATPATGDNS